MSLKKISVKLNICDLLFDIENNMENGNGNSVLPFNFKKLQERCSSSKIRKFEMSSYHHSSLPNFKKITVKFDFRQVDWVKGTTFSFSIHNTDILTS